MKYTINHNCKAECQCFANPKALGWRPSYPWAGALLTLCAPITLMLVL